jgi:hypothetical protein
LDQRCSYFHQQQATLSKKLVPHAAQMIESQAAQFPLYSRHDEKSLSNEQTWDLLQVKTSFVLQ